MTSLDDKKSHVAAATQTRFHRCHWPGCKDQVAPARWGCYKHWMKLSRPLQAALWRTYRVGQEEDGLPSKEYVAVAKQIQEYIKEYIRVRSK